MTLIKSKINSLAWLKSAICFSVLGAVISYSKPASAISVDFSEDINFATLTIRNQGFVDLTDSYTIPAGSLWKGNFNITQESGVFNDVLNVRGIFQHNTAPHPEDGDATIGNQFTFNLTLDADNSDNDGAISIAKILRLRHPANHSDFFQAILTANVSDTLGFDRITDWELKLTGEHQVPEPTTIVGSALALGVGGWLKRKKSSQQNKTTSPH